MSPRREGLTPSRGVEIHLALPGTPRLAHRTRPSASFSRFSRWFSRSIPTLQPLPIPLRPPPLLLLLLLPLSGELLHRFARFPGFRFDP